MSRVRVKKQKERADIPNDVLYDFFKKSVDTIEQLQELVADQADRLADMELEIEMLKSRANDGGYIRPNPLVTDRTTPHNPILGEYPPYTYVSTDLAQDTDETVFRQAVDTSDNTFDYRMDTNELRALLRMWDDIDSLESNLPDSET